MEKRKKHPINKIIFIVGLFLFFGCGSEYQPKPKAYLSLNYPKPDYKILEASLPFSFEYNTFATVKNKTTLKPKIVYPQMKATVYLNYSKVKKNLDSLLNDAYQLPAKHMVKAAEIDEKIFIKETEKVYGGLFIVTGDAASQYQFYLTDSLNHFLIGSLYFYSKPNYDSIYPAAQYIQKDIVHLIESIRWEKTDKL